MIRKRRMSGVDRVEAFHLSRPPGSRRRIPERMKLGFGALRLPEWHRSWSSSLDGLARIRAIENRPWGGFSRRAMTELEAIKRSRGPGWMRAQAGWTLVRRHSARSDHEAAYGDISFAREAHPAGAREKRQLLPEAKLLCLLGRPRGARAILDARGPKRRDPSIAPMRASSHAVGGGERAELAEINAVFGPFGPCRSASAIPAGRSRSTI